ncbi:hypothetical protein P7C70_g7198, partial [Phenoliferia sp. Uapishka_3]
MPPQHTCEWNHCRQSFATKPDLARHLSRLHKGRRPDPIDLHLDANEAFRHRVFWDGVAQRRGQAQRKRRRGNEADADDESSEGDEDDDRQPRRFRVETYPEAGWACDADGNRLDQQFPPPVPQELLEDSEAPYHPFDDKRAWNWANRSVVRRMTRSEMNELIADHEELEESPAPFKNMDHLRATIGQIEFGMEWATWKKKSFTVAAPDPETLEAFPFWGQEVTVYMRDTDALVSELLRRPSFVGRQRYAPQRISLPDGEFITEPHTGSGMWEFQSKVPRGTLIKRINLASDATVCSIGTGQVYVHPVYISISTNDPALIRNGEAQLLAGFLPVLKNKNTSSAIAEMFRRWARTVRHECMRLLTEPLKPILSENQLRQTADGHCCSQFPDLLSEGPGEPRTTAKSSALRAEGHAEARAMGLHPEETFYVSLNIDGHGCIRADSLHQLEGGVFKQINLDRLTLPYLKNACGGGGKLYQDVLDKIVKRLSCIPSYTNIRRFKDSITFGQWTHKSSRNLMAVGEIFFRLQSNAKPGSSRLSHLSWIYDKPPLEIEDVTIDDGVPQSFALIAIIYMYANSLESTATDRKNLDYAVNLYYTLIKEVFAEEREGKGFNWMKAHSLWHYTQWTQTDGVPSHSNTSCYEAAHKQIKEFWRASNKCESLKQIMWANIRHDVMASFRIRLERSGTLPVEKQFEEPVYLPARTVLSARGDRLRKSSLADLGRERNLAQLETLVSEMLLNPIISLVL